MNLAPGVTLESLKKYYKASYDIVRKYCAMCMHVIMSNSLSIDDHMSSFNSNGFFVSVIDAHFAISSSQELART
ncbi:hypothetical protein MA16_Dca007327 [Dendrobium catenatum]|uniref:Uncharacterized protein n=1 Tax=Dendrobium catenatum TaxID=906689 RepID=A0A2I0W8I3_9ASPA|nr:hypothetical protein MA16_Dca007327 [Dendrobium catenatum]